ncbi:MAG: hypothetical protein ACPG5L_08130 [Vibrio gallaecicus]
MSFDKEWGRESSSAMKAIRETYDVISIELFSGVITSSAVGNPSLWKNPKSAPKGYTGGTFRGSWILSFDSPSSDFFSSRSSPESKISIFSSQIKSDKKSRARYLTNNLPYSERLEYDAWSKQQPLGVIQPNLSRVNALVPQIESVTNAKYGV